jgi:hypothetical protein
VKKDSENPYASPSADPSPMRMEVPDGSLWRVEEGRLLVRDRASLPDLCIYGSPPEELGKRKSIPIHTSRLWVLLVLLTFGLALFVERGIDLLAIIVAGLLVANVGKRIRVMVFESSRVFVRNWLRGGIASVALVGSAALLVDSLGLWDAPAGNLIPWLACWLVWGFPVHRFRAVPQGEGWYEIKGIAPPVIVRLAEIQRQVVIRQDDIRERRRKR